MIEFKIDKLPAAFCPPRDQYAVVVCTQMMVVNWRKQSLSEIIFNIGIGSWKAFCDSLFASDNVYQLWIFDNDGKLIDKYIANG